MNKGTILRTLAGATLASSLLFAGVASAQSTGASAQGQGAQGAPGGWGHGGQMQQMRMPGVFGTVASINGSTITVTSKPFAGPRATSTPPTATTYTVDASNATVMKNGATSAVSSIAVGDTVMIEGTVSGTNVAAKMIRDGVVPQGMPGMQGGKPGMGRFASSTPSSIIKGNGEPVIGGSVSALSGSTLTVTNMGNQTYSVDASNAIVEKGNATSSVSAIAIGDNVVVQGSISGTNVTASSVLDQGAEATAGQNGNGEGPGKPMGGILGAIGGFFQHLFGFF